MIFACLRVTPLQHRGLPVNATPIRRRYCPSAPPLFQHGSSTNNSNGQTTEQSKLQSWGPRRSPGHRGLPEHRRSADRGPADQGSHAAARLTASGRRSGGRGELGIFITTSDPFNPTLTTSMLRKDVGNKGTQ